VSWRPLTVTGPEAFHQSREIRHLQWCIGRHLHRHPFHPTVPLVPRRNPGNFVAQVAGGHFEEGFIRRPSFNVLPERNLVERWRHFHRFSGGGPLSKSGPAAPRLVATQLWSASGTKKHPPSSLVFPFAPPWRNAVFHSISDVLFSNAPGPATDFDAEAKLPRCPRPSPILQARRGNIKGPQTRGMFCWAFAGRAAQTGAGMGAFASPIFDLPPPVRLDDELHDEGCSIVPLQPPDPTLIVGPPGTHSPVSGPRIRNPEDSWRLACPGHSKRCG
jgi:hypothetical protein